MRVLITGSDGFAGRHLTRLLEADGHAVTRFGRHDEIRDYGQVRSAMVRSEPDLVFHLAAVSSPAAAFAGPRRALDVNLTGALNVLEAARLTSPDTRVLIAGTSDEYGEPGRSVTEMSPCRPRGPYGASKLAATALAMAYAQSYSLQAVVTRAFMHTGPGHRSANVISGLARQVVAVERGDAGHVTHPDRWAAVDLTDVRDVVEAYRLAITLEPGIYNVCRGEQVTFSEILHTLVSLSTAAAVPLREDPARWRGETAAASCAPLTAAGWKPLIPLEQTLADLLGYWRSR